MLLASSIISSTLLSAIFLSSITSIIIEKGYAMASVIPNNEKNNFDEFQQ